MADDAGLRRILIAQPIDPLAHERLVATGFEVREASVATQQAVTLEIGWADGLIVRNLNVDAAMLDAGPDVTIIGVHGVGTDRIDLPEATRRGIAVFNTPNANAISVAEHAMALLLGVAKRLRTSHAALESGDDAFRYAAGPLELSGRTVGVVGFGRVGRAFATLARAFGMRILIFDPFLGDELAIPTGDLRVNDIETLLRESDVVSLHVPLTPATNKLIDQARLALMKRSAILVNTARGALIDEAALAQAVAAGVIAGAGLDVFATEPVSPDHPLLQLDRVLATPHLAGSSDGALRRAALELVEGIQRASRGDMPASLVNDSAWPRARRRILGLTEPS